MDHDAFFEQTYEQVVLWICERSGLPREIVETVIGWESHFWQSHPGLYAQAVSEEDDDGEWFCSHE